MPSPIESSFQILTETQSKIAETLGEQSQTDTGIFITTGLTKLINKLSFQLGVSDAGLANAMVQKFAPVTNFMGEEIKRTEPVSESDLQPIPTDQEMYLSKLNALQSSFRERKPETLISDFSSEPLLLRGLAKRAGLEDYETGEINIDFIERIAQGLDAIDMTAKEEEAINQQLGFEDDVQDVPDAVINKDLDPAPKTTAELAEISSKATTKTAAKKK